MISLDGGVFLEEDNSKTVEVTKNPTNKKLTIFNFIFIAIVFVGLFIYMVCVDGIDNIIQLLKNVNYFWVLAGLGCLIVQWICEAFVLHLPIKRMYPNI